MPRVLVVQQDRGVQSVYADWLEAAGFEVATCTGPGACDASCPVLLGDACSLCQQSDLFLYSPEAAGSRGQDSDKVLLERLRSRHPCKPIVVGEISGRVPDWLGNLPGLNATVARIEGPALVALVRNLLREARRSRFESGAAVKLLEVHDLYKSFAGSVALDGASLEVFENEVVGLVGENGAGKSTILNILSGVISADRGKAYLRGSVFAPRSYREATLDGVFRVYQEQALVPNLPVYENLFLSHEDKFETWGVINRREMIRRAKEMLSPVGSRMGIRLDPTAVTGDYDFSVRQVIEIVKACSLADILGIKTPLILLDEPTTALSSDEILFFISLVRELRERAAFVFVSHRLTEVLGLSDRIYVLKDGRIVDCVDPIDTTESHLHELMVGRKRDERYYKENLQVGGSQEEALCIEGLSKQPFFSDVTFTLHAGEIVGLGGVLGSGKSEVGKAIIGALTPDKGAVTLFGHDILHATIGDRIKLGLGYVPQERHLEGGMLYESVSHNIILPSVISMSKCHLPLLDLNAERQLSSEAVNSFHIRTPSIGTPLISLSGGNQQKVILARWLAKRARVLVLDNPTRGVDAGAKEEIYEILRGFSRQGVAILLITDDILELIGLSDRILIMRDGLVTGEVRSPADCKPSERELVAYMV